MLVWCKGEREGGRERERERALTGVGYRTAHGPNTALSGTVDTAALNGSVRLPRVPHLEVRQKSVPAGILPGFVSSEVSAVPNSISHLVREKSGDYALIKKTPHHFSWHLPLARRLPRLSVWRSDGPKSLSGFCWWDADWADTQKNFYPLPKKKNSE